MRTYLFFIFDNGSESMTRLSPCASDDRGLSDSDVETASQNSIDRGNRMGYLVLLALSRSAIYPQKDSLVVLTGCDSQCRS